MQVSPRYSFVGYSFTTWLSRNKELIKTVVSALGGVLSYYVGYVSNPAWNLFLSTVAGVFVKLLLDAVDFWLTDVVIE